MFYTYNQNNPGGEFEINENLKHFVIIEAGSAYEANAKAEELGIYFDGIEKGIDCSCCGDRWYRAEEFDANKKPLIFGKSPKDLVKQKNPFGYEVVIYYKDGNKEIFY